MIVTIIVGAASENWILASKGLIKGPGDHMGPKWSIMNWSVGLGDNLSVLGALDWRTWVLTSVSVHLLILLLCFVLAYCDKWPSLHHKRVEKLSPDDRTKIREVVEENWDELLKCSKNLIDARLEDGEKLINCQAFTLFKAKLTKCNRLVRLLQKNWKLRGKNLWSCQGYEVQAAIAWWR